MATADTAVGVIMWVVMLIVYFVPFVIAHHRRSKNCAAVLVINLFLGWTFIGRVVALVLAVWNNAKEVR